MSVINIDTVQKARVFADLVTILLDSEGVALTLLGENPEAPPNIAVEVCADWTGWKTKRFEADTLLEALRRAETYKRLGG